MTLLKYRGKTPFHCDSFFASAGAGVSSLVFRVFVLSDPTSLSGCVGSLLAHGPLSV